ncbi:MAG: hypothetical protein RLZZ603_1476 [Actinomycetota bacterium]
MHVSRIQITDELNGVLAVPDGQGPWPAVVMVHEVFGIDDAMRAQIERLCSAGYVVLMPNLFSRGGARKCLNATFKALTAGELLANRGYNASSVNYGMLPKDLDSVLSGACPIIASYGAKDGQLKGAVKKLETVLDAKQIPHDLKEYPDAGHAFMNPHQAGGPVFGTLLRITGAKPNPEAAKDAWARIEAFFGENLG